MSIALVKPGNYNARIAHYGITRTKSGDPQVAIQFSFLDANQVPQRLTWRGGFSEKAMKHTLKALIVCGLQGEVADIAMGPESNALDMNREVSISVQHEEYDGKTYAKVAWVNQLGGAQFQNLMNKQEAANALKTINLKGELMAARQDLGIQEPKRAAAPPRDTSGNWGNPPADWNQEDVGF